jgi:hypothetical protein
VSVGERGGSTASLEQGQALIEEHKASLSLAVRNDILIHLEQNGEWHRDNLTIEVPASSKNVVGAVVSGLISSGLIQETGERRRSSDPASHGRKSNVYRLRSRSGGSDHSQASAPAISGSEPDRAVGSTGTKGSSEGEEPSETARLFELESIGYRDAA